MKFPASTLHKIVILAIRFRLKGSRTSIWRMSAALAVWLMIPQPYLLASTSLERRYNISRVRSQPRPSTKIANRFRALLIWPLGISFLLITLALRMTCGKPVQNREKFAKFEHGRSAGSVRKFRCTLKFYIRKIIFFSFCGRKISLFPKHAGRIRKNFASHFQASEALW